MGPASLVKRFLALFHGPPSGADDRLPNIDAHMHYNREAWSGLTPNQIVDWLGRAGVSRFLVSSTPDDGSLTLHRHDAAGFVAEMRP